MDTGCSLEDLLEVMDNRDEWPDRSKSVLVAQYDDILNESFDKKKLNSKISLFIIGNEISLEKKII